MAFVDLNGLNYFYTKIKSKFALSSHGHSAATTSAAGFMSATDKSKLNALVSHGHSAATTSAAGFMSATDKSKLNDIETGATKNTITQITATLTSSGWSSNKQSVTVNGVTATNMVMVAVDNIGNGIECTAQGSNTLTFTCDSVPSGAVTVYVTVLD